MSDCHLQGGELIWQIGTGYFGCRDEQGQFSLDRFKECVDKHPIRAIELKLSQGAKPGLGGMLPGAKVTPEIARIRGIPVGKDCHSPSAHSAFSDVDSMLDFVEQLADVSGLPVGIKSAVGGPEFWRDLAQQMATSDRGVDYIAVDGGEGGTGAAPLVFSDNVALPFRLAFVRVYREFFEQGLHNDVVFVGSGKLGFPARALLAFTLGCDIVHVGREPMLAMRGLDPTHKGARLANYVVTLRKELLQLARASGVVHPDLVTADQCEILSDRFDSQTVREVFRLGDSPDWGLPSPEQRVEIERLMSGDPVAV